MLRPPLRRKTNEFLTLPNEYDSTAGAPTGGFFMDTGNQSQKKNAADPKVGGIMYLTQLRDFDHLRRRRPARPATPSSARAPGAGIMGVLMTMLSLAENTSTLRSSAQRVSPAPAA